MKARKSWAMAYCGMAAALSVALMLLGAVVPVLMFIAPAVASLLIATVCVECGRTMALTAYGAVSLLSLLFVPDKEVALVFVFLLGYYPLVKPRFERIRLPLVRVLCKLLLCNGAVLALSGLELLLVPEGRISQALPPPALVVSLATRAAAAGACQCLRAGAAAGACGQHFAGAEDHRAGGLAGHPCHGQRCLSAV